MEVSYRPATVEDARVVAAQARDIDHNTAYALGYTLEDGLMRTIRMSAGEAWTACADGQPVAVFGVVPLDVLVGVAFPWLVPTRWADQHKKLFYRQSRLVIAKLRERFPVLTTIVDVRHERSLAWVRRLGFTTLPAQSRGPSNLQFYPIVLEG